MSTLLKRKLKDKNSNLTRRKNRVNKKIKAINPEYRLVLNKSNLYIFAQLLSQNGDVVTHITDKGLDGETKTLRAQSAGKKLAEDLKSKKIDTITIDRNGYRYHGRVKLFVEGIREGGIKC